MGAVISVYGGMDMVVDEAIDGDLGVGEVLVPICVWI